ncbi:MAG: hypothetical protein AB7I36_17900 [Rhodospirillaceae bacterium]
MNDGLLSPTTRSVLAFSVPKREDATNEDRWRIASDGTICALCDGASISYDPAPWADQLTERFVTDPNITRLWLDDAVSEYLKKYDRENMEWMQQAAFDRGSFATLVGIIWPTGQASLRTFAMGDSIVALVGDNTFLGSYPLTSHLEFDQPPTLLSTNHLENSGFSDEAIAGCWHTFEFDADSHQVALLMTDALGRWLLEDPHSSRLSRLLEIGDEAHFANFIEVERAEGRLKRDDSTLIILG